MSVLKVGEFYGSVSRRWRIASCALTELEHRVPRTVPAHTHERPYLSLLVSGSYREATRSQKLECRPWSLTLHPAAFEHQDEIGRDGASFFLVEFEGDWLETRRIVFGHEGGEAVWAAARLWRSCREGKLAIEASLAELVGCLQPETAYERTAPAWLMRVEDRLRTEFIEPPPLDSLAADIGVHPVHLSRTFRAFRGEGLGDFVRRQRVLEAARLMLLPDTRSIDIAADVGFADQSHMVRSFKQVTRLTPGQFRAVAQTRDLRHLRKP